MLDKDGIFNDKIMYDPSKTTIEDGISLAKDLIGIKKPYFIDRRYDGLMQPVFSEHFLNAFAKALSFNCIADMTEKEKDLYFQYIEYTGDREYYDITSFDNAELVLKALDTWAMDELLGNPHPEIAVCE